MNRRFVRASVNESNCSGNGWSCKSILLQNFIFGKPKLEERKNHTKIKQQKLKKEREGKNKQKKCNEEKREKMNNS